MFQNVGTYLLVDRKLYVIFVLLSRIGIFIGIGLLLMMPHYGQVNRIEETPLNPQLLNYNIAGSIIDSAEKLVADLKTSKDPLISLKEKLDNRGVETYLQHFQVKREKGLPIQGTNLIARLHTKRTQSYECNLFVFKYSRKKLRNLSVLFNLVKVLQQQDVNYLSRDVLFVAYDGQFSNYGRSIRAFLEEYYHPQGISKIPRSGTIRAGFNLDLDDSFNTIALKLIGLNSRVSNRDYVQIVNELCQQLDIEYQYIESEFDYFFSLQEKLEKTIRWIWPILQLDKYYPLPQHQIFIFAKFFAILRDAIQGQVHDAHSYMLQYGIHSITLRGFNSVKGQKTLEQYQQIYMIRVLEGANRALMALDEYLHAGSSMFLPLNRKQSLTISWYVWPIAIIGLSIAVLYTKQTFDDIITMKDDAERSRRTKILRYVWTKEIIMEMTGFLSIWIPQLMEYFTGEQFCVYRDYVFNADDEIKQYLIATVILYALAYFLLVPIVRRYIFQDYKIKRNYLVANQMSLVFSINMGLGMIFCLILNFPASILIALTLPIWTYFIQPIRPCLKSFSLRHLFTYSVNLVLVVSYGYLIFENWNTQAIISTIRSTVLNNACVGTHAFYYMHVIGFTGLVRFIDILLY